MSLTDARREAATMRAAFSTALEDAADACEATAEWMRKAAVDSCEVDTISRLIRQLVNALNATCDITLTWAAVEAVLGEIER